MGLTIHYSGRFNEKANLQEMIDEVRDIVEINKWNYHIYETQFPKNGLGKENYNQEIYGISFSPPECEPVWLTFLSNGKMSSPVHLKLWSKSQNEEEKKYLYQLFTKTQYAGAQIHKIIIHILKHINKKYLSDFKMYDEGSYWETGDEKLLDEIFQRYNQMLDSFSNALQTIPIKEGESIEDFIVRVAKKANRRSKKK